MCSCAKVNYWNALFMIIIYMCEIVRKCPIFLGAELFYNLVFPSVRPSELTYLLLWENNEKTTWDNVTKFYRKFHRSILSSFLEQSLTSDIKLDLWCPILCSMNSKNNNHATRISINLSSRLNGSNMPICKTFLSSWNKNSTIDVGGVSNLIY